MSRRRFLKQSLTVAAASTAGLAWAQQQKTGEYYELRVYELRNKGLMDEYLSKALIPALNRAGVKSVGAFTELGKPEPPKLYLLIVYASITAIEEVQQNLSNDKAYAEASRHYESVPADSPVFWRYSSSLMKAFDGFPQLAVPKPASRILELRTYEGYSEDAVRRKVKMFNDGEIDIFRDTKLNIVFFGHVWAGDRMPCLTYMLSFANMEERDANWQAFIASAEWQRVSKLPEYANTVSKIHKTFLEPLPYSQV